MLLEKDAIQIRMVVRGRQKGGKYVRRESMYVYQCIDCNQEIQFLKSDLIKVSGRCRKCADHVTATKLKFSNAKRPYEALFNKFNYDRKRQKQESSITYEEFVSFTAMDKCHYCDEQLTWAVSALGRNGYQYNLDRKDNREGYSVLNCVTCCWFCNEVKGARFSYEEFTFMAPILKQIRLSRISLDLTKAGSCG